METPRRNLCISGKVAFGLHALLGHETDLMRLHTVTCQLALSTSASWTPNTLGETNISMQADCRYA